MLHSSGRVSPRVFGFGLFILGSALVNPCSAKIARIQSDVTATLSVKFNEADPAPVELPLWKGVDFTVDVYEIEAEVLTVDSNVLVDALGVRHMAALPVRSSPVATAVWAIVFLIMYAEVYKRLF